MITIIEKVLWVAASVFLIGCGLFLTKKLHFIQFQFKKMFAGFKYKGKGSISPFKSLMMSSAARIGVASLAGVALAIYIGGIGTIFWIWLSAIIIVPNAFAESCLGIMYREKDKDVYKGGPAYYIKNGLGKKNLGKIYAIFIIIAYIIGFLTIQSNTITKSLETVTTIPPYIIGIIIAISTGLIIVKGVKGIADACSKLVPILGIFYMIVSGYIIISNIDVVPDILLAIVKEAFNIKALGSGVVFAVIVGVQRGIASNEAGIGSAAIASATTDTDNPVGQGLIEMLGIYFISFIICSATALIILTSDYQALNFQNINGIEITQYALTYHLGDLGNIILIITIFLFAFSTIITGYYYGESNLKYLFPKIKEKGITIFKLIVLALLVYGSVEKANILWGVIDLFVAAMAIINIYAIYSLREPLIKKYYSKKTNI